MLARLRVAASCSHKSRPLAEFANVDSVSPNCRFHITTRAAATRRGGRIEVGAFENENADLSGCGARGGRREKVSDGLTLAVKATAMALDTVHLVASIYCTLLYFDPHKLVPP